MERVVDRKRRARVAHVITLLELGGAQENTLHTVRHLDRERFDTALLAGAGGMLDAEARAIPDLTLRLLPDLIREIRPARDLGAFRRLVHELREFRPDIVHTHSSKAGIVGRWAARAAGVPILVHSVHGFGFTPGQRPAVRGAFKVAERATAPMTDHFIAVSRANLEEGVAMGLFPRERVTLIRSGIPLEPFRRAGTDPELRARVRAELAIDAGETLVGCVSCLKPQKDPLTFAEVAKAVLSLEPDVRFVLAGDGVLRAPLEGRLRELGIADRVRLLGWRRDVPELMAGFDLLLHVSRWEGLPRVLPQAMACGRAIVATAVDGSPEAVREGVTGYLARPRDVPGLAAAVLRLVRDPRTRAEMGEKARELVDEFDVVHLVPAQERLYARLLLSRAHAVAEAA